MTDYFDDGLGRVGGGHHYDPNQPRVPSGDPRGHGGRWTREDSLSLASSAAPVIGNAEVFGPSIAAGLRAALVRAASLAGGAIAVFAGALLVPAQNETRFAKGRLRDNPDVRYHYDGGFLTVAREIGGSEEVLIYHGLADVDGLFRTAEGAIIGRDIGNGVVLNEQAIEGERWRRRLLGQLGTLSQSSAENEMKLCPDATPERPTRDKDDFNVPWRLYQHYVTGVQFGYSVILNGVEFDGCRSQDGAMQEAKGPGFEKHLSQSDLPRRYRGKWRLIKQLTAQSDAASGRLSLWYAAEESMADYIAALAKRLGLDNVVVFHVPYPASGAAP